MRGARPCPVNLLASCPRHGRGAGAGVKRKGLPAVCREVSAPRRRWSLALVGLLASVPMEKPLLGHWEGMVSQPGGDLKVMVDFAARNDAVRGTIDLPAVAAFHWPLTVTDASPTVKFRLP